MCKELNCVISFVLVLGLAGSVCAELLGHWNFNEGSGNVALDLSGNGYDGVIEGAPNWVVGVGGSALEFDGIDDYVGTDQSLLNDLSEFTLALWVNPVNYPTNRVGLVDQNDCTEFGFNGGGGNVTIRYPYESGEWHHVAAVGDAGGMVLYIDDIRLLRP